MGVAFVVVAVCLAVTYASRSWISSRKVDGAQAARPAPDAGPARDGNAPRLEEIREAHRRQLQPVLRMDAERLSEIARRIRAQGRVTDLTKERSDNAVELRSIFVSHRVLGEDLQNHYPEYAQAKERLRRIVSEQEEELHRATQLVMAKVPLSPGAEHRRLEVARALLAKCLDRGPGVNLTATATEDEREAFEAFTSFQPDSNVAARCRSLKRRAAGIAENASKLSSEARALAERTTLPGDCKHTSPEQATGG